MTNGRPSPRSPGRTPPFILVGLLLLVCVLAYNYWTLSARNGNLTARTEKLETDVRSASDAHDTDKKSLDETEEKLRIAEGNLDQVRQSLKEKEAELESLQNEQTKLRGNENKCKEELNKCDGNLETKGQNMESVMAKKTALEEALSVLKSKESTCGLEQCLDPVRNIVAVFTKVADPQTLRKALESAQMDSIKIMGPVEIAPQGDAKQNADRNANIQPNNPPQVPQVDNLPNAKKAGDQVNISTVSMDTNEPGTSTPASSNVTSGKLVFLPDAKKAEGIRVNVKEETENVKSPAEIIQLNINDNNAVGENNETKPNDNEEAVSSETKASLQTGGLETSIQETGDSES